MKRFLVFPCLIAFFFSCSSSDDLENQVDQPDDDNFYALTVGNSWVYKSYQYNPNTEDYDDTGIIDREDSIHFQQKQLILPYFLILPNLWSM